MKKALCSVYTRILKLSVFTVKLMNITTHAFKSLNICLCRKLLKLSYQHCGALIGKDVRIPEHETLSFERSFITLVDLLEKRDEEKPALNTSSPSLQLGEEADQCCQLFSMESS